jgi:hypothetical protein
MSKIVNDDPKDLKDETNDYLEYEDTEDTGHICNNDIKYIFYCFVITIFTSLFIFILLLLL